MLPDIKNSKPQNRFTVSTDNNLNAPLRLVLEQFTKYFCAQDKFTKYTVLRRFYASHVYKDNIFISVAHENRGANG